MCSNIVIHIHQLCVSLFSQATNDILKVTGGLNEGAGDLSMVSSVWQNKTWDVLSTKDLSLTLNKLNGSVYKLFNERQMEKERSKLMYRPGYWFSASLFEWSERKIPVRSTRELEWANHSMLSDTGNDSCDISLSTWLLPHEVATWRWGGGGGQ